MLRTPAVRLPRPLLPGASRTGSRRRSAPARAGALRSLADGAARTLRASRRLRIALVAAAALVLLSLGSFMLLRRSALVAVERVEVAGVQGPQAQTIRSILVAAGRRMSTLDYSSGALRAALAAYPVVRGLRVSAQLPHTLRIDVLEQLPVAVANIGGVSSALAADGTVLGHSFASSTLPTLPGSYELGSGGRVSSPSLLDQLSVLAAAPAPLARLVTNVADTAYGITLTMRGGLLVYFGNDGRPHAKWLSLARVLQDPSSAGAHSIDVRLPERPAAAFAQSAAPAQQSSNASTGQAAGSETTVSQLESGLGESGSGSSAPGSEPQPPATPAPAETQSAASTATSAETPPPSSEAPAG